MEHRNLRAGILALAILLCQASICFSEINSTVPRLKAAATIFPVYDIARNIAGERADVVCMVRPGASPHTFALSPSDIKNLRHSRIVFSIGHSLDSWTERISGIIEGISVYAVSSGIELKPLESDHHHHHHHEEEDKGLDPHYWLSTANAKIIAANIAGKFIELDQGNREYYLDNLRVFQKEMDMLSAEINTLFGGLPGRELIVFHESWNYFAGEFDLEIAGVFTPAPGKEPSPQYLKELYDAVKEHNISAVFSEPQFSSESIKPFIKDFGLKLYILDPLGGVSGRDSFRDMLLYNARTINHALRE
ncbi:metal ABC transporter substrate-binding protein [Elusimicrobiota bacterium]